MKKFTDPISEFNERVAAVMNRSGVLRTAAVMSVVNADPGLHSAYLVATNDAIGRHRAVDHLR